ncbi:MAG: hypothetical protein ABR587_14335 [Candidatus Binatia bacterium]
MRPRTGLALVCAVVIGGFVAWSWPLPLHLSTHILMRETAGADRAAVGADSAGFDLILANDQNASLWGAAENARALLGGSLQRLIRQGQCYPLPEAGALGEHMIELGVLASPWWLMTGDPVASYNLLLLTSLVIGAAGMFLFLHRHTSSALAAALGSIAFALATPRLVDLPYHPAVIGTHWIPWVLWSFDRVLGGERGGALLWFALTLLLSGLVGSYPLLAVALVGAAYGAASIVARWRSGTLETAALVRCVAAASPAIAIIAALLLTYVRVQHDWLLMPNPGAKYVVEVGDYLPGGPLSVGTMGLLGLVPLGMFRRGTGANAVPGLVIAAVMAFLVATALPLPGGATWGFYEELAVRIPIFDSVRAPGKIGLAVCFAIQALGAIGWGRLFERLSLRASSTIAMTLLVFGLLEIAPPPWARGALGTGAPMQLREVAPARETIDALAAALSDPMDRRPVLDLPTGRMVKAPLALLDAAYHGHPTSACYNSLVPPTIRAVEDLIARSRSAQGVAELAAAGFGFVIERPHSRPASLSSTSYPPPARLLVFEGERAVWGLPPAGSVHSDVALLTIEVFGGATRPDTHAPEFPHELDVVVTNRSEQTWMAPRPLQPWMAEVELVSPDGSQVFRSRARGVLPLALAAGGKSTVQMTMPEAPETGTWRAAVRIDGVAAPIVVSNFSWADERR